jgi:hypothetical protein
MTIKLITQEQFDLITDIKEKYPALTLENKGYESICIKDLTVEEKEAMDKVSAILKDHITGFRKFSNFRTRGGEIQLRIQYDWNYDKGSPSFTGVGYLMLEELLNGFNI